MYKRMASVLFVLACFVLTYCPISLYNLPVLLAIVLVSMVTHQLYEWMGEHWQRHQNSDPSLVAMSDTLPDSAEPSEEDSEDENTDTNMAIKNAQDSDNEDESSPEQSEDLPEPFDGTSCNNSRTSEISMSSYEAVSFTDLKPNDEQTEKTKLKKLESAIKLKDEDDEDIPLEEEEDADEESQEDEEVSEESCTNQPDDIEEQTNNKDKSNNSETGTKKIPKKSSKQDFLD